MWPELIPIFVLLCLSHHLSPVVGDQDHVSEEDLLASLLGDNDSPPLSAEGGVTILGTGAVDPATTLDCHRRLYSYRVSIQMLILLQKKHETSVETFQLTYSMACHLS